MSTRWLSFWDKYRHIEACSDHDLFVQVGKTIERRPIPRHVFDNMVARITEQLDLTPDDHLFDMCCGNGLITYELAQVAGRVTAIDFARHLIETARQFKSRPNITYHVGDITLPLGAVGNGTLGEGMPRKFLINDSLAYFEPTTLGQILDNICNALGDAPFRFLLTEIPNHALRWNFYDTPERKARHQENLRMADNTNDGLGRWWQSDEIEAACQRRGLQVLVANQPETMSNYRMDALIWR